MAFLPNLIAETNQNGKPTTRVCEACRSTNIHALLTNLSYDHEEKGSPTHWRYRLLECANCGLGFVDPKPTWDLLQTFYDESYGNYNDLVGDPSGLAHSLKYRLARMSATGMTSKGLRATLDRSLSALVEWVTGRTIPYTLSIPLELPKDAYIFDLGYGSGNWLLTMVELGFQNLCGYDIDSNKRNDRRLRDKGIELSGGSFLQNDYPLEAFDCVRLDHVLEHLADPLEVLKRCRGMLKRGGFLVMSLPCKNSWSMSLSLTASPALQLPKHLYHHTQQSVRLMLESAGFDPLRVQAYSVVSQLGGTLNGMLRERNARTIPPLVFEIASPMYRLFGELTGRGDFLTVWAR